MALILTFRKSFFFLTNNSYFQMPSKRELNKGKYWMFFCSEVDGLRILAISPEGTANIFLIWNIPLNYVYLN